MNLSSIGTTIKQVRLGQRFGKLKFAGLIFLTISAFVFGLLVMTKSCKAPAVAKPVPVEAK